MTTTAANPVKTTEEFLGLLFLEVLTRRPDFHIATWSTPSKHTHFHKTHVEAARAALALSGKENSYFAVCPVSPLPAPDPKTGLRGRGKLENYGALVALWADIDLKDPVHKKAEKLPASVEEAMLLMDDIKVEPSIVVHSGHGLQAFWILEEPWIFADDEDRAKAQEFTENWHKTIKYFAERRGWTVDSVFDLPRILRVPGTLNIKNPDHPKIVEIIEPSTAARYSLDRLECFILAPELLAPSKKSGRHRVQAEPVLPAATYPLDSYPPFLKILAENDPQVKKTLDRARKDLADQSPSSYDLSLANQMVLAGYNDQEIADAIAWWRARHCTDPKDVQKAHRRDYLQRTITRARTDLAPRNDAGEEPQQERIEGPFGITLTPVEARETGRGNIEIRFEARIPGQGDDEPMALSFGTVSKVSDRFAVDLAALRFPGDSINKETRTAFKAFTAKLVSRAKGILKEFERAENQAQRVNATRRENLDAIIRREAPRLAGLAFKENDGKVWSEEYGTVDFYWFTARRWPTLVEACKAALDFPKLKPGESIPFGKLALPNRLAATWDALTANGGLPSEVYAAQVGPGSKAAARYRKTIMAAFNHPTMWQNSISRQTAEVIGKEVTNLAALANGQVSRYTKPGKPMGWDNIFREGISAWVCVTYSSDQTPLVWLGMRLELFDQLPHFKPRLPNTENQKEFSQIAHRYGLTADGEPYAPTPFVWGVNDRSVRIVVLSRQLCDDILYLADGETDQATAPNREPGTGPNEE